MYYSRFKAYFAFTKANYFSFPFPLAFSNFFKKAITIAIVTK